jgi:hypothetical protein
MGGLALVYSSQGRHDEGEKLLQEMLLGVEAQVGSDHPHALLAKRALADAYKAQAQYAEAEPLFVSVREAEKSIGPLHDGTPAGQSLLVSLPSSIFDTPFSACESLSGW